MCNTYADSHGMLGKNRTPRLAFISLSPRLNGSSLEAVFNAGGQEIGKEKKILLNLPV